MNIPRGYNANTILQDGSVFTIGGSWKTATIGGKVAEVFSPGTGWRVLSGIPTTAMETPDLSNNWVFDSHFWLIPAGNGRVFHAGPGTSMHWIDTRGDGSVTPAGTRGNDASAVTGAAVMYDTGKIFKAGGTSVYANSPSSNSAYLIDITGRPIVTDVSPMIFRRGYVNSAVLPDGKVLLVGGQTFMKEFSDSNAVLPAELFDPERRTFRLMDSIDVARNYHAVALLLPDGRVLSAGGGLCGTCSANHPDLQIFSPPYLFAANGQPAVRPQILSAPTAFEYGRTADVRTNSPVSSFALVRMSSVTHTVNNDQRRVTVPFKTIGTNSYRLELPSNPGWFLPGYWMLFALNNAGTPSVARIVHVKPNRTAEIVSPFEVQGRVGTPLTIPANVRRLGSSLRFWAAGLPSGLKINAQTGTITGTPTAAGTFKSRIKATVSEQAISTEFIVSIAPR